MSRQPIDFKGMIDLDPKIVEQLAEFLREKEGRVADHLAKIIAPPGGEWSASVFPPSTPRMSLEEGIEEFGKKMRFLTENDPLHLCKSFEIDTVSQEINSLLWELTEALEGAVVELFQRVQQMPIDQLLTDQRRITLSQVVHSVKDLLQNSIDRLSLAVVRLEKLMQESSQKTVPGAERGWFASILFSKSYLDNHFLRNLTQTKKFLKSQYSAFEKRYREYFDLTGKVEECLHGLKNRPNFTSLDASDQNLYASVFRLLKMMEFGRDGKKGISSDLARALGHLAAGDSILLVFSTYYEKLKKAFIKTSMEWKYLNREDEEFKNALQTIQGKILDCQQELRELMQTMGRYRTFLLKNDPNPYTRTRWGFTEWIVGPEPARAKKLLNMIFTAEELNGWLVQFRETLGRTPGEVERRELSIRSSIEGFLHDMGQPLISKSMMRNRAASLLEFLKECDETGSPDLSTISYVEDVLSKAMREDWQYHVLHGFPLFHEVYRLHQTLLGAAVDASHLFRLGRFQLFFDQIEEWVEKQDTGSHIHEIELDMMDMKTYLQDFLAAVQRAEKEKSQDPSIEETIRTLRHQLLEYRYLFGQFFFTIMSKNREGKLLRNQFLFVDQYFESAENALKEDV